MTREQQLLRAAADLLDDDTLPLSAEEVDDELRAAGLVPREVGRRMRERLSALVQQQAANSEGRRLP